MDLGGVHESDICTAATKHLSQHPREGMRFQRVPSIVVGRMRQTIEGRILTAGKQREGMPGLSWFCGMLSSRHHVTIVFLNSKQL